MVRNVTQNRYDGSRTSSHTGWTSSKSVCHVCLGGWRINICTRTVYGMYMYIFVFPFFVVVPGLRLPQGINVVQRHLTWLNIDLESCSDDIPVLICKLHLSQLALQRPH